MADLTHADLVARAARWLRGTRRCSLVFTERACWSIRTIPDALGFGAHGVSVLVECKTSRADYLAGIRRKAIHRERSRDREPGSERWYMTPPGLLDPGELPEGWGLLEVRGQIVRRVKLATPADTRINSRARADLAFLVSAYGRHRPAPAGGE